MSLPVVLSPDADFEFEEAATWYERNAAMGERFIQRIQESLNRISEAPERHALVFGQIRRIRVRQFHYGVYYRIQEDRIEVIAVFHDKRDPKNWQSRA